jgi:dolichol-phosphate mannosyltransferase
MGGGSVVKLSIVIPAYNESGSIESTLTTLVARLEAEQVDHEVVVIDDGSTDGTLDLVRSLGLGTVVCRPSHNPRGFGFAVRAGLDVYTGDAVAVMMADGSDRPEDLVRYYRLLEEGYECAFGSRFVPGAVVKDYPRAKLVMNRMANKFIQMLFRHGYNDTTNAFKAYRREVIDGIRPLLSNHFNLTVELPLKSMTRGYSFAIVPIAWTNRTTGTSKLRLKEMGSRYIFIVLYVFLEHHLSRGDYRRSDLSGARDGAATAGR